MNGRRDECQDMERDMSACIPGVFIGTDGWSNQMHWNGMEEGDQLTAWTGDTADKSHTPIIRGILGKRPRRPQKRRDE